jgi:tRNA pseudouridine55 synthase
MNGLVLVDKPAGLTSHDVVNRWRKLACTKRVGHLGTLDPMATGLLALVTGTATRLARFFGDDSKTYNAHITFGLTSTTYDAEGVVTPTGKPIPAIDQVAHELGAFAGPILQVPPAVSAKKIGGVPAYKLVRQGATPEMRAVEVRIHALQLGTMQGSSVSLSVRCSSGTYIRSLAHDLGERLGCGAILTALRRTAVGCFGVEQAWTLPQLTELASSKNLASAVIPSQALLPDLPSEHFDFASEVRIRQGRDFHTSPFIVPAGAPHVRALSIDGELIAIGELRIPNLYHPSTVL